LVYIYFGWIESNISKTNEGDKSLIGTLIKKFINITNDLVYLAVRRVCKRVRRSKKTLTRYGCKDFLLYILKINNKLIRYNKINQNYYLKIYRYLK